MPVKRQYSSIPVKIGDGGKLLPDLPCGTIGAANFDEKINIVSEIGEVRKRAGWDFPAPTDDWLGELMELFGVPCEAIKGVRRPNGTYAIVGCGSSFIKAYHYDLGWVTIGSGFSTMFDAGFRWWQIEDIAGYAVFNNGLDLMCWWQIGDAAVTPMYEFREAGYASCGTIVEYVDGVLMVADLLEINDAAMDALMNSTYPYQTLLDGWGNLLLQSQTFDSATWVKTNNTITPDATAAPDGTVTADLSAGSGVLTARHLTQTVTLRPGAIHTFSVYVNPSAFGNRGRLMIGDPTFGVVCAQAEYDTDGNGGAGSVVVSALAGSPTSMSATIELVTGIWYRVTLTASIGNITSAAVRIQHADNTGAYVYSTVASRFFWGAQLESTAEAGPYLVTVGSALAGVTRISFNRAWSNIGDPTDWAVTVPGSITATSPTLTLAWPMASFSIGDEIEVLGAGVDGGNLQTTITNIAGPIWTLADNASTTVADNDVARPTDINSIAGWDAIEDDGSAIVIQMVLKTQLMSFKASGHIWQTYYTGDLDTPFAKDRVTKKQGIAPVFPRAIVNIVNDNNEEYLLFPGAKHFYRYDLGSQAPQQEPLFMGAEKELFFSRIRGLGPYDVWAAVNAPTDEVFFAYVWDDYYAGYYGYYGSNRAVALKYAKRCESLSEISGFTFTCAATVQKPLADFTCDENEMWFVMGAGDGTITLYGETNLEVLTRQRYGESFEASLGGGLFSAGPSDNGSYARRFSLDPSNPDASRATEVSIYGARSPNDTPVLLETKTLTDPRFPGCMGLYYRKPFYKYRLVTSTDEDFRISGFIWRIGGADTQNIDRLE